MTNVKDILVMSQSSTSCMKYGMKSVVCKLEVSLLHHVYILQRLLILLVVQRVYKKIIKIRRKENVRIAKSRYVLSWIIEVVPKYLGNLVATFCTTLIHVKLLKISYWNGKKELEGNELGNFCKPLHCNLNY